MIGRVKWYSDIKKYGFILAEKSEFFVHCSNIVSKGYKILKRGAEVEFLPEQTAKGWQAVQVVPLMKAKVKS